MKLWIHPLAGNDAALATAWYRQQAGEKLAFEFIAAHDAALQAVLSRPLTYPVVDWLLTHSIRRLRFDRPFPYTVFYRVQAQLDQLQIIAIAHHRHQPGYWINRL